MNKLRLLFFLSAFLVNMHSFAQITNDPTTWKYEVKKKSATEYQLIFHLTLQKGWHIWSLHPGGDGYEIAPSFVFDKTLPLNMKGATYEKGQPTTTTMEGVEGKVTYFSGKVDYIQDITVTGSAKITGKHTYQVCNDRMCLPPKDKDFVFTLNP